jgi:hypothetical protein
MATEPQFIEPLSRFAKRICYSNLANDTVVPYCTGAIRSKVPFDGTRPLVFLVNFPCVALEPNEAEAAEDTAAAFEGDSMKSALCSIVEKLSRVGWTRFAVEFTGAFPASVRAHEWICGKNAGERLDIPRHILHLMNSAP